MFFTKTSLFAARLIGALCVFRIVLAVFLVIDGGGDPTNGADLLLGVSTTGEAINQATIGLGIALILGTLAEISKHLSKANELTAATDA